LTWMICSFHYYMPLKKCS